MIRRVCVTGASSQIGVFLLPRLLEAGCGIIAVSRQAPPGAGTAATPATPEPGELCWVRPDAMQADSGRLAWAEALVSCGPLDLAAKWVQQGSGLQRVVAFSSSSVLSKADSGDERERLAMASLAAAETRLREACRSSALPLLLLRPTLIWGCGRDRNVSLLAAFARRFGFLPLAGRARGLRQPVHADDLAALVVLALRTPEPPELVSPVCGGETLSYREMAARVAAAVGRPVRLFGLPAPILQAAVTVLSRTRRLRGLNPEMVRRQDRDLVFDDSPLRDELAWSPRPFAPTPGDFEIPPQAQALQLPP